MGTWESRSCDDRRALRELTPPRALLLELACEGRRSTDDRLGRRANLGFWEGKAAHAAAPGAKLRAGFRTVLRELSGLAWTACETWEASTMSRSDPRFATIFSDRPYSLIRQGKTPTFASYPHADF